jgi:hypothetical protein
MRFINWLMENATIPNLLLFLLLGLGAIVLISALRADGFRLGDMIIDERGKASSSRISMFIALGLSSYMLAYLTINRKVEDDTLFYIYAVYLLTWASSKTLDKAVSAWSFSKGYGGSDDKRSRSFDPDRLEPRNRWTPDSESSYRPSGPDSPVDYMRPK